MKPSDARFLQPVKQQQLRNKAIELFLKGKTITDISRQLQVSRQAVYNWIKRHSELGKHGLKSRKRGRPKAILMSSWQSAQIVNLVLNYCPDELSLPFFLWTREAVALLIKMKFNISPSKWTVGRYLTKWGFSPQKPARRAIEQSPQSIERWLKIEYPSIQKLSRKEKATIYWGDEMGLRSDHNVGRTYGIKGKTPIVKRTGNRFSCNMISAITNLGKLSFMVFRDNFIFETFLVFLKRLIRQSDRKVFLIVDRHPAHKSKIIRDWLTKNVDHIRLYYLPSYCPELNPDEFLNQDVKSHVGKHRPHTIAQMLKTLNSHLKARQKQPQIIQGFVRGCHPGYSA
jgi:transposase